MHTRASLFGRIFTSMILSGLVISCASKPKLPKPIPEPSVLDPKRPASLQVQGLEQGKFYDGKKDLKLKFKVENYPLGEKYQKIAYRLNDSAPKYLTKSPESIEIDEEELKSGANVFRAYLVRAWGESIKNPESNVVLSFYYKEKIGLLPLNEKFPVLTLTSPRGEYFGELSKKILFDLLLQGPPPKKSKKPMVRYSLNGTLRDLPLGKAVFFENLPTGTYTLKVDLINKSSAGSSIDLSHEELQFQVTEQVPD